MSNPVVITVTSDVTRGLAGVNKVKGATTGLGSTIKRVAAAAGLAVLGRQAVKFAADSVRANSDAQQSIGATESVYGKYADRVIRHSKRAATAVGVSASEYRNEAAVLGALFKNQGVEQDKLAGKTRQFIGLGSDLAATYGGKTKDAVEALGSAFKGEFDPLERYGISIKQSAINAELASKGQDKLTGAALRQAQQQATTALIMRQSADAQGQFARESTTLANVQQITAAKAEDLKATIGGSLTPALSILGRQINANVLPPLAALAEKYAPRVGKALGDIAQQAGPAVRDFLTDLPDKIRQLQASGDSGGLAETGANLKELAVGVKDAAASLPSFTDLLSVGNVVLGVAADHTNLLKAALPALAVGFVAVKAAQAAANVAAVASVPTKIAEVVVNRQLVASNRALIASRSGLTGATVTGTAAENAGLLTRARAVVGMVAQRAVTVAITGATRAWAAGQWLLNAALTANPIGLVVVAIAALVAGLVIAYKHSETFRKVVDGALHAVGETFKWLWSHAVQPALTLVLGIGAKVIRFMANLVSVGAKIPGPIGNAFKKVKGALDKAADGAENLTRKVKGIPTKHDTKVTAKTDQASRDLGALRNQIDNLPKNPTIRVAVQVAVAAAVKNRASVPLPGSGGNSPGFRSQGFAASGARVLTSQAGNQYHVTIMAHPWQTPVEIGRAVTGAVAAFESAGGRVPAR